MRTATRSDNMKLAGAASDKVSKEWLRRAEAEYRSAALAQHLTLWLIQIAAPIELITDGLAIVKDELNHARLSFHVFKAAGGQEGPQLLRETLQLPRSRSPLEHDVLRCNLRTFVLGESVAVRLFKRLREQCSIPQAREALDTILNDEVRHREFGWVLVEWMLSTDQEAEYRRLIAQELPDLLRQIRESYGPFSKNSGAQESIPATSEDERAWGLMPLGQYRESVVQCFEADYRPRFLALGIATWTVRPGITLRTLKF